MGEYFRQYTVVKTFLQKQDRSVFLAKSQYQQDGYPELYVIKVFNEPSEPNEFLLHSELSKVCPSIIKIYDSWSDGQCFYMSIEYCENGDLHNYFEKFKGKRFEFSAILIYCHQVAETVLAMHELKVCHRDIKPLNIYIKENFQYFKLGDFGEAKSAVEEPGYHTITGTPFYMSPEQKKSLENRVGFIVNPYRDDIWALGRTFVEISFGRLCPEMYKMGIADLHSFIERNFRNYGYDEDFIALLKCMFQEFDQFQVNMYQIVTELQRIYFKLYPNNYASEELPVKQEENWLGIEVKQIEKEFEEIKNENFEYLTKVEAENAENHFKNEENHFNNVENHFNNVENHINNVENYYNNEENHYKSVANHLQPSPLENTENINYRNSLMPNMDDSDSDQSSESSELNNLNFEILPPKLPPPNQFFNQTKTPETKNPLAGSLPRVTNINNIKPSTIQIDYNSFYPAKIPKICSSYLEHGEDLKAIEENKISSSTSAAINVVPQPVQKIIEQEEKKIIVCSYCKLEIQSSFHELPCKHICHPNCIKQNYEKTLKKMDKRTDELTCLICNKGIKFGFFDKCLFLDPVAKINVSLQIFSQTNFNCPTCKTETKYMMLSKKFKARDKKCQTCKSNYCTYCGVRGGHRIYCDLLRAFKNQKLNMKDFINT